ncbi:class I SAM-dependent methyltransferase [Marinicella sp. W31]|uniref:class I SAM-dependent methyltransferase n=1 Tax=Marinicella sp. W31 TaxID=3023713 RepID=UPI0037567306
MSSTTLGLSENLKKYIQNVSVQENACLRELREETSKLEMKVMQISPEQGQFMSLLVNLIQAKNIIEVGVFTGYSSICLAQELPDNGRLVACDVSEEWTNIAKKYWHKANLQEKIDLQLAPAHETLTALKNQGLAESFDMAFIDADKTNYVSYYNHCLDLLKPGGLLLVDNTLWSGSVADVSDETEDTVAIRQLNQIIAQDVRVKSSLLTVGDGLTLVLKL